DHGTILIPVLDSHLGLTVGPQPWALLVLSHLSELGTKLGCKDVSKGHELRRLVSGIAKHMALITSSNIFRFLCEMTMNTLSNVWALLLNVDKDLAVISIKAYIRRCKPNASASISNYLLIVYFGLGRDLAKDHHHVSQATLLSGSCSRQASRIASETWSQSLSGWPSLTDSEVKRKVSISQLRQVNRVCLVASTG
ncbi:hypothetical protein RJ639_032137, partial [Escallonia herrerae]